MRLSKVHATCDGHDYGDIGWLQTGRGGWRLLFDKEGADRIAERVNGYSYPDHMPPGEEDEEFSYNNGSILYDPEGDRYIYFMDDRFLLPYDSTAGEDVGGMRLYEMGADWCWSIEGVGTHDWLGHEED